MTKQLPDLENQKKTERRKVPQKINLNNLPKEFREALGISSDIKSINDVVEQDQFIQETLENIVPELDRCIIGENKRGYVPRILLRKRNTRIIFFTKAGFKTRTILDIINRRDKTERWGFLKNERAINKIREKYAQNPRPLVYENEEERTLIESGINKQQEVIEKFALAIYNIPDENDKNIIRRSDAQCKLIKLQQAVINNQQRNSSRYYKTKNR